MKAHELIKLLEQHPDAEVVRFDWFGRPLLYTKDHLHWRRLKLGDSPYGAMGHFLCIEPIDIGPEPE